MLRGNVDGLLAFLAVAREGGFTRAAAKIGVSQSTLSHAIRGLETRLGLKLLNRTTRSVSVTAAGERLLATIGQRFDEIESELVALSELRDKPAGFVRITAVENAARTALLPKLERFLPAHPDIKVEIVIDYGLTDIVTERFDAGIRSGETVHKDMISVPIAPDMRIAVVASPAYLAAFGTPTAPQELVGHRCINLRLPTHGGLYAWEFERDGKEVRVQVDGQLVLNTQALSLDAALSGLGLAYLAEEQAAAHLGDGRLVRVLEDWCPPFAGYHLYYPSRLRPNSAFALLVEALRYKPVIRSRPTR